MISGPQLRRIAEKRLEIGRDLIDSGDYTLAIEMFGMALECALKACVCETLKLRYYPDFDGRAERKEITGFFRSHDFDKLLLLAGLQNDFELRQGNNRRYQNWSDATKWDVSDRYEPLDTYSHDDADRVYGALTKPNAGVLTYIWRNQNDN